MALVLSGPDPKGEYLAAADRNGAVRSQDYLLEVAALHLALLAVPGVGTVKAAGLLKDRGGVASVAAADDELGAALRRHASAARAAVGRAADLNLTVLPLEHPDYPPALVGNVSGPPPVLFVQGAVPAALAGSPVELRSCAIVGTRRASRYSLDLAETVGRVLARHGVLVVSGLAVGVDGAAHRGALAGASTGAAQASGTTVPPATVAVLGGGHLHLHPASHTRLAERIVDQGGALLSEWPPDAPPARHNFLRRNRIISALARCVLVVEAARRSGALSTASHAVSQGRHLLVVPGRPDDPRYAGNLGLLRDGAGVFFELSDVLLAFGITDGLGDGLAEGRAPTTSDRVPIPWTSPLPAFAHGRELGPDFESELGPGLVALADTVRSHLESEAEASLDKLLVTIVANATHGVTTTPAELTALLTAMELAGEVELTPGGRYRLRRISAGAAPRSRSKVGAGTA